MAFVNLILSAGKLKQLKNTLIEEKIEARQAANDPKHRPKFKFRHVGIDLREGCKKWLRTACRCSETSPVWYKLKREGSCENYTLKSALGFLGGVFLTYLLYFVFIFQLNVKLTSATVVCGCLGCVLTVGLAFSSRIRCIVLLTLPQFFSKRGRQALLAYAFVLALTGPAQNTLNNLGILSESLACGQEQLKQAVKQIIDVIKKPFKAIKEAIKKVVKTVKEIVKKIKEILLKIKRIIMSIVRVIKSVFEFLGRIINICNKELGTPFQRCTRVFENAIADCNAKLGPLFSWLCSLAYIVKAVCYLVKMFDYVCMVVDFISNSVVGVIIRKVKIFVRHIKTMFYVRIKFSHSFEFKTVASKSYKEIAKGIVAEIKERSKSVVAFFNFMTSASMLFFLYLVFQVAYYRFKYLTSERFDNVYITKYFRQIDLRRAKSRKETVLPLTKKEQQIYVPIAGGALSKSERKSLWKNATKLATASVKLGTHMAVDYSLYWVLSLISHHARYQSKVQAPNLPVAHITGDGFLAVLLRAIVNAFQPVGIKLEIDTVPCLPIPIHPDFDRYIQIGVTVLFCWILTIFEPYGLRFRNWIMGYYHPLRAKQRTVWLYNHILRSRTTFLMLARRKLRKKFGVKGREDEISCKELLRAKLKCTIFKICLGSDLQLTCLLCGDVFREKDKSKFIKCPTPQCPGLFCLECFADLKNICPVCLSPLEYGDLDELDQEKDSSGDEPPPPPPKRKCPVWWPCGKSREEDQKEDDEDEASSTDYSYSYQFDGEAKDEELEAQLSWRDLECQTVPDEASMEAFNDYEEESLCIDLDNQIRLPGGHKAAVKLEVTASQLDEDDSFELCKVGLDCTVATEGNVEEKKNPRRVEFIGLPLEDVHRKVRRTKDYCTCSDMEDYPKSTMSTSTRSDCKFCACSDVVVGSTLLAGSHTEEELRQVVPKLDLSFLTQACTCSEDNPVLSNRFSYVTYREECETPASARSLQSSSVLTALEAKPAKLRRRLVEKRKVPSPSFEAVKAHQHKVQEYYQKTRQPCGHQEWRKKQKRRSIGDMFRKLLPKRNKLPYHRGDLPDDVQVQSYNYNDQNWDTINLDSDSPTYPFGTSSDSEKEEEEKALLGGRRIRGGQCTHVTGPTRFDPKSRSELKDFATLSLPPKPKPDTKQFINLFNLEDFSLKSMKSEEGLENREDTSDYIIPREAAALLVPLETVTPPSSDSGLSDSICVQLFGRDCPQGIGGSRTSNQPERAELKVEETEDPSTEVEPVQEASLGSQTSDVLIPSETVQSSGDEKPIDQSSSEHTLKSSSRLVTRRTSSQLNQLLYKDDRTEISLVQKLNPEKVKSASAPPRPTPSVKLQINLHNSIIPEETPVEEVVEMKSPRSQDKMVETRESFPLHPDWTLMDSKMNKTQQTSENDIYKRKQLSGDSLRRPSKEHLSHTGVQCNDDVPEKDCKTNCQCSICLISRLHQFPAAQKADKASEVQAVCACCKCKTPRSPDLDPPDFVLPPPPPPPLRRYPYCNCYQYNLPPYPPPPNHLPHRYPAQPDFYSHQYQEQPSFADLPYQNNDDYLELVQELEETLHSRNRNRVKRAMQEFEKKSKQNQPLERPIIDYDDTSESEEPIIRKIDQLRGCCAEECGCGKKSKGFKSGSRFGRAGQGSRWRMDPNSGEWQKGEGQQNKPKPGKGSKGAEGPPRDFERCYCSCNCEQSYK